MPVSTQPRRFFGTGPWSYQRVPCDPPPEILAQQVSDARVANAVAKRIREYERFHHQHTEHHKNVLRGVIGGIGLLLSVGPSAPALYTSCREGLEWECGLRISALTGGTLALAATGWGFWDLYKTPSHLAHHVDELNRQIEISMHAQNGEVPVTRLLDLYQSMSRSEQTTLKNLLEERAREPRNDQAAQRAQERKNESALTLSGLQMRPQEAQFQSVTRQRVLESLEEAPSAPGSAYLSDNNDDDLEPVL